MILKNILKKETANHISQSGILQNFEIENLDLFFNSIMCVSGRLNNITKN